MNPQARSWLRWTLGLLPIFAFAAWLWISVDLSALAKALAGAKIVSLVLVMPALVFAVWGVKGARWLIVLDAYGSRPAIVPTLLMVGTSLGLATVTPAQLGELFKVGHARSLSRIPVSTAAGGYAIERVVDLLAVLALTAVSASAILPPGKSVVVLLVLFSVATVLGIIVIFAAARFGRPAVVARSAQAFRLVAGRPGTLALIAIMTLAAWLISGKLWQVAMAAVDVDVGYRATMGIVGLTTLVGLVSLVPAAVGVAEVSIAAILSFLGHDAEAAAAAAISLRVITIIGVAGGALCWAGLKTTTSPRD